VVDLKEEESSLPFRIEGSAYKIETFLLSLLSLVIKEI
jgi:hypothetical protein